GPLGRAGAAEQGERAEIGQRFQHLPLCMTLEWRNGRIVLPDLLVLRAKEEPMQFKGHVLDGDEQQRLGKALLLRREELDEEDLDAVFPEDQSDAIEKLSLVWEAYGSEYLFVGYSAD